MLRLTSACLRHFSQGSAFNGFGQGSGKQKDRYVAKETLQVAGAAVAAYIERIMDERGTALSRAECRTIELGVQEQLSITLRPVLGLLVQPLQSSAKDGDFSLIKPRRAGRLFFADMANDKIWEVLRSYSNKHLFLHGEDVAAGLFHGSHGSPPPPDEVAAILWHMRSQLGRLKPRHLATLFTACQRLRVRDKLFYQLMFKQLEALQEEMDFRGISEIIIAASVLPADFVNIRLLENSLTSSITRVRITMPSSIARLLHALASSCWLESEATSTMVLITSTLTLTESVLTSMNSIDVAQCLNALFLIGDSQLRSYSTEFRVLVQKLCEQAVRTMPRANLLDVAEVMRAAVYLRDAHLFEKLCGFALEKLPKYQLEPRVVNDMMWALMHYEYLGGPALELRNELFVLAKPCLPEFRATQLAHFLEVLAHLKGRDEELIQGVCEQAKQSVASFSTPQMILTLLRGYLKLGVTNNALLEAMFSQAAKFPAHELSAVPELAHVAGVLNKSRHTQGSDALFGQDNAANL